jgi:hypothetical protein
MAHIHQESSRRDKLQHGHEAQNNDRVRSLDRAKELKVVRTRQRLREAEEHAQDLLNDHYLDFAGRQVLLLVTEFRPSSVLAWIANILSAEYPDLSNKLFEIADEVGDYGGIDFINRPKVD